MGFRSKNESTIFQYSKKVQPPTIHECCNAAVGEILVAGFLSSVGILFNAATHLRLLSRVNSFKLVFGRLKLFISVNVRGVTIGDIKSSVVGCQPI